jgi:tRNA-(ms[2]io[6]A)-hydroxylase
MAPIRRLPVLQEAASSDDARPPWHWTLIGALFALSIWVPLAMLSSWLAARAVNRVVGEGPPDAIADQLSTVAGATRAGLWLAVTAMPILSFAVACVAAGALVGRFGNRAGAKEAALGGALAAAVGALLSAVQAGWVFSLVGLLVLAPVGAGAGWLGGRLGWARRPFAERRPR